MARMSNKERLVLETALSNAKRARAYLDRPDIAVGMLGMPATTTLHFTRQSDGQTFYPLDKHIGSHLAGLESCIVTLEAFLARDARVRPSKSAHRNNEPTT